MELLKRGIPQSNVIQRNPPHSVLAALDARKTGGNLRCLDKATTPLVDFSSNDYLGFSTTGILKERISASIEHSSHGKKVGSTGSRLLAGNEGFEELEECIAAFHGAGASLIFNSGYDANLGLISSLPTRHDTILFDELSHASLRDGIRLSIAKKKFSFRHNDLDDLRNKIKNSSGQIFIVVESVYSMDGDFAPLIELCGVALESGGYLIVDEAHAVGIFGDHGRGRVSELSLENSVFATIVTFGKALGCHGAAILGSKELREYLINFAHSFIYTTALDNHAQVAIKEAYRLLEEKETSPANLFMLISEFRHLSLKLFPDASLATYSPIQGIVIPSNEQAKKASAHLLSHGLSAKPILHPTVPTGQERLRICLHTFNGSEEIQFLLHKLREVL